MQLKESLGGARLQVTTELQGLGAGSWLSQAFSHCCLFLPFCSAICNGFPHLQDFLFPVYLNKLLNVLGIPKSSDHVLRKMETPQMQGLNKKMDKLNL